ncbi:MAG TPA: TolC family protein [Limnobacter sp.]|nr:TolC family protein [Limnobacter sp.]
MNKPRAAVRLGCALGALLCMAFQTAQGANQGISIASAFESALAIDPELQAAEKRLESARYATEAANSLTPEPLSLEGSYRSDRNFDNQGLREVELGVVAPVWLWGERKGSQNLANAELEMASLTTTLQKLELAQQVRQAYWNTMAAHLDVEIAQARLVGTQRLLSDVEKRVAAGDLATVDQLQAQALHAQAKADFGNAVSNVSLLAAEFTALTGLPASAIGDQKSDPTIEGMLVFRSALSLSEHPALLHAKQRVSLAQARRELAGVQSRPNPEISLGLVSDKGGFAAPEEKSLMIGTRIPLGSSAKHQIRILTTQADELAAQASLRKLESSLKARAQATASSVSLFEELKKTAEERAKANQEAFALIQKSFELGETDLPTLLRFEQQAFEAQRLARKATVEHAAKVSDYKQALGILPENNL